MLENLILERVVVHEVLTAANLSKRKTNHSSTTVDLDDDGKELICDRLIDSIGSSSHCEEMLVADNSIGSAFQLIASIFDQKGKAFIATTAGLADRLSGVQAMGSIKDGLGVFLQGTGEEDGVKMRWVAIINGRSRSRVCEGSQQKKITLRYVANLIMGAQQRMLKVAFFIENERHK